MAETAYPSGFGVRILLLSHIFLLMKNIIVDYSNVIFTGKLEH
jgi:hypothetical protein